MHVRVTFDNSTKIDFVLDEHMTVNNFIRRARWIGVKSGLIPSFKSKIIVVEFL